MGKHSVYTAFSSFFPGTALDHQRWFPNLQLLGKSDCLWDRNRDVWEDARSWEYRCGDQRAEFEEGGLETGSGVETPVFLGFYTLHCFGYYWVRWVSI